MRSMSPAPWMADTTMRRSVATGACRASSANAFASAASRSVVDPDVLGDDLLGQL